MKKDDSGLPARLVPLAGTETYPQDRVLDPREGYDLWSSFYDDEDNPLIALENRFWDDFLPDLTGRRVLDVGCGTGRRALDLSRRGGAVTGIDFSEGMLEKLRAKRGAENLHCLVHDLAQPFPFADSFFDLVSACLVLEHVTDLTAVFREMARVCAPEGTVVISELHPAMHLTGVSARFTDPVDGRQCRPRSALHQIGDFVLAANQAGLIFDRFHEGRVDEELIRVSPRSAKYLGWPLLLLVRLRPIAPGI